MEYLTQRGFYFQKIHYIVTSTHMFHTKDTFFQGIHIKAPSLVILYTVEDGYVQSPGWLCTKSRMAMYKDQDGYVQSPGWLCTKLRMAI